MAQSGNTVKKNTIKGNKTATKKKKKTPKKNSTGLFDFLKNEKLQKVVGVFLILLSIYMLFAFSSYLFTWGADDNIAGISFGKLLTDDSIQSHNWTGKIGAALSYQFIKEWFGIASYLFCLILFIAGTKLALKVSILPLGKTFRYSIIGVLWLSVVMGFIFYNYSHLTFLGGQFGYYSYQWLQDVIGKPGTIILLLFVFIAFVILAFNWQFKEFKRKKKKDSKEKITKDDTENKNIIVDEFPVLDDDETISSEESLDGDKDNGFVVIDNNPIEDKDKSENSSGDIELEIEKPVGNNSDSDDTTQLHGSHKTLDTEYDPKLDLPDYKFPTLDLLTDHHGPISGVNKDELEANKNKIVTTLRNYTIGIDKIKATIGPAVTLYEIVPSAGVRINKIKNLEDDIALSLAADGIRIIAPIPGKGTIGIEVPNQTPEIVSIKSVISSERFQNSQYALPFCLGKTISNESYVADLTKMPHILMAGATGQGKSVGLNTIIASLLYKKHPAQLKFVMVDPKKVELSLFSKIERHYLAKLPDAEEAIITDTRQVVRTLNSLNIEMDNRYNLLKDAMVRNIAEYNKKFIARKLNPNDGHRFLPYIIVVVDEFADLIMTAGREIETPLTRLAQLARAIGIHLIIATQRPSVNIITGTIKANFPARIAFRVISKIDSRTILDSGGADQLVGRGDMLLSTGSDLVRIQCAYVDIKEVEEVTEYIGSQRGYPAAFLLPEYLDENDETSKEFDPTERDELFEDAAFIVVQHQHGSTSLLQRKLKIGYNRAGRIIDQLEAVGIVGAFEGSKAREVKVKNEMALEQFLKDIE